MNKKALIGEFTFKNLLWWIFFVLLLVGVGYYLAKRVTGF